MGDSLTDTHHWANREVNWPSLLKKRLEEKYKSPVTIINPAIGGTQLRQNLVLIPTWLAKAPEPDLVTLCFGGNDWDAGMRGKQFRESYRDAADRIRRTTKGKADVLIVSTVPSAARWGAVAELAEACRQAAHDRTRDWPTRIRRSPRPERTKRRGRSCTSGIRRTWHRRGMN